MEGEFLVVPFRKDEVLSFVFTPAGEPLEHYHVEYKDGIVHYYYPREKIGYIVQFIVQGEEIIVKVLNKYLEEVEKIPSEVFRRMWRYLLQFEERLARALSKKYNK